MPALKQPDAPQKMTFEDFMQWSEDKEGKWELHDGVPTRLHDPAKMHSERVAHVRTKYKIMQALENAIAEQKLKCEALGDGMTVKIDDTISYKPDALVYCDTLLDDNSLIVPNPIIIVEVLSPSTAYKDISTKLINYFQLPSVMHYLIIDPANKPIQHHFRKPDGTIRMNAIFEDELKLDPPNLTLDLRGILG